MVVTVSGDQVRSTTGCFGRNGSGITRVVSYVDSSSDDDDL